MVSAQELQEMKTLLLALLDHPTNVAKLIPGYTYPIVIYLMSVYSLELLRIQQCADIETFNKGPFTYDVRIEVGVGGQYKSRQRYPKSTDKLSGIKKSSNFTDIICV